MSRPVTVGRMGAEMAWKHARKIPLIGVVILAAVVLTRLSLMTFWSFDSVESTAPARLVLFWILAVVALAMLSRFAWQIWTGRHQSRWGIERQ
jgi:hypothetical protein